MADLFTATQLQKLATWTPEQWADFAFKDAMPSGITDPVAQADFARSMLKSLRRPGDPKFAAFNKDYSVPTIPGADSFNNLAYAEHYAYARFVVAKTGDVNGEKAMIYGYEANKVKKFAEKKSGDLGDEKYKPSPPSMDAVKYGVKGAEDGLKDFRKASPDKFVPFGEAVRGDVELASKQTGIEKDSINKSLDVSGTVQRVANVGGKIVNSKIQGELANAKKMMDAAKRSLDAAAKRIKDFKPMNVGETFEPCKLQQEPQVETSVSAKIIGGGASKGN